MKKAIASLPDPIGAKMGQGHARDISSPPFSSTFYRCLGVIFVTYQNRTEASRIPCQKRGELILIIIKNKVASFLYLPFLKPLVHWGHPLRGRWEWANSKFSAVSTAAFSFEQVRLDLLPLHLLSPFGTLSNFLDYHNTCF